MGLNQGSKRRLIRVPNRERRRIPVSTTRNSTIRHVPCGLNAYKLQRTYQKIMRAPRPLQKKILILISNQTKCLFSRLFRTQKISCSLAELSCISLALFIMEMKPSLLFRSFGDLQFSNLVVSLRLRCFLSCLTLLSNFFVSYYI